MGGAGGQQGALKIVHPGMTAGSAQGVPGDRVTGMVTDMVRVRAAVTVMIEMMLEFASGLGLGVGLVT